MKKLFYIFILLISARSFNAQITLAGQLNNGGYLSLVHLSTGYNFAHKIDSTTPAMTNYSFIRLYDLNLNPFKTIPLPTFNWPGYNQANPNSTFLISDHLFNADNSIEFIAQYNALGGACGLSSNIDSTVVYVMNENGFILATLASDASCAIYVNFDANYFSDGSTFSKLILRDYTKNKNIVYNLPGFLPCESCSMPTGFTNQGTNSTDGMKVDAMPNPSSGDFTFQYTLPKGKQNGELTITDIGGSQVKTVHVSNQTGSVNINMSDLSSGVYIFQLKSGNSQSIPQKIILAK